MSTAFDEAWATTDERPSMSQDELIAEFTRLDALVKEHGMRRREIGAALAEIAAENKGNQNTVKLESSKGERVKVEFGSDTSYDTELMKDVLNLLGSERFDELFQTEISFKPKRRNLKGFLNTVSSQESIETAKRIIQEASITTVRSPYVSVERGSR